MQDFWNKMNEVEKQNLQTTPIPDIQQQNNSKSNTSIESIDVKPQDVKPKPRKKLLIKQTSKPAIQKSNETVLKIKPKPREIIKSTHIKLPNPPVVETITFKEAGINFNSNSETESEISEESESSDEETDDNMNKHPKITAATLKPSNTSTLAQRSLTSLKDAAFTPEVLQGLQKEVENVLNSRLEEIGISPEWSTLPICSYHRALNIVTHQANLIQKNVANYMHIQGQILKDVDEQVLAKKNILTPQKRSKLKSLLTNVRNKAKLITQNEKFVKKPVSIKSNITTAPQKKSKVQKTHTPAREQSLHQKEIPKPIKKKYV